MHQPTHDTTEAALLEAMDSWGWWERTCEYWRETAQRAWRERDFALAKLEQAERLEHLAGLCNRLELDFSINSAWRKGVMGHVMEFEGRVEGPRGWNNGWGPYDNEWDLLQDMITWITEKEK